MCSFSPWAGADWSGEGADDRDRDLAIMEVLLGLAFGTAVGTAHGELSADARPLVVDAATHAGVVDGDAPAVLVVGHHVEPLRGSLDQMARHRVATNWPGTRSKPIWADEPQERFGETGGLNGAA